MKSLNKTPFFFLFTLIFYCSSPLSASTYLFNNAGGDNLWSNPLNWNPSGTPGTGDEVTINNLMLTIDLDIDVKTLNVNGSANVVFIHSGVANIGTLNLSGGSLSSTNKIVISDGLHWTGNSSITNVAEVELSTSAVSTISGSSNRSLYTVLVNKGQISHTGGSIRFQAGGSLSNQGTFTTDGSAMFINTGGSGFNNEGTFNKTGSSALDFFSPLNQSGSGQLNVNEGSLRLLFGGIYTSGTTLNVESGATLDCSSGNFTLDPGSTVTGSGTFKFSGGSSAIESNYNLSGTTEITSGTVNFNGSNPINLQTLTLSGGTLQGTAPINIITQLNWTNSASISSSDTLTIKNTATCMIYNSGSKNLYTPILNEGQISYTAGALRLYAGGSLKNKGSMIVDGPGYIYDNGGAGIVNEGSFDKQSATLLNIQPGFSNESGGIVKSKGILEFDGLTNKGTFFADAGYGTMGIDGDYENGHSLTVEFDGSSHGNLEVSGNVALSGELNIDYSGSVPDGSYVILSTSAGTISGKFDVENVPPNLSVDYGSNAVTLTPTTALPLELNYFRLISRTKRILLRWQTASETNGDRFVIEHSTNGRDFIDLGSVNAVGFSDQPEDYAFLHESPTNGENYYRLRQIDLNRHIEYSDIRVLSFYNFDKEISVFPNPTQGAVVIKNQSGNSYTLQVIDTNGKIVRQQPNINSGATMLDLSGVAKGVYTLKFFDGAFSFEEQLMILE